jgi:hypothetical protein
MPNYTSPVTPYDPNRQRNVQAPSQTYSPFGNTQGAPGGGGGGGNPYAGAGGGGQNPTMPGQVSTPATATTFGTSPALDQGAVWNSPWAQQQRSQGWQGYGQSAPLPGQQAYGYDPWAGNEAGKAAFDQQRNAAMNAGGAFGTAPALDQNAVWNQYAGVRAAAGGVPPPPGGPAPNNTFIPKSNYTTPGPQAGDQGAPAALQQQLAQYGITPDMWQQLMQMFSNQALGPNYSTGGN